MDLGRYQRRGLCGGRAEGTAGVGMTTAAAGRGSWGATDFPCSFHASPLSKHRGRPWDEWCVRCETQFVNTVSRFHSLRTGMKAGVCGSVWEPRDLEGT